ncbi:MAG: ArsR/SmtB family transcription factor [Terriglobales bacterium]
MKTTPASEARQVRVLRALGDPTRYRMVAELAAAGELCCGAIGERFPLAQPTISHHVKVLAEAGLITVRRRGQHALLSLNRAALEAALAAAGRQLAPPGRARQSGKKRSTQEE